MGLAVSRCCNVEATRYILWCNSYESQSIEVKREKVAKIFDRLARGYATRRVSFKLVVFDTNVQQNKSREYRQALLHVAQMPLRFWTLILIP